MDVPVLVYGKIVDRIGDADSVYEVQLVVFIKGEDFNDACGDRVWDVDQRVSTTDEAVWEVKGVRRRGGDVTFLSRAVAKVSAADKGIEMSAPLGISSVLREWNCRGNKPVQLSWYDRWKIKRHDHSPKPHHLEFASMDPRMS